MWRPIAPCLSSVSLATYLAGRRRREAWPARSWCWHLELLHHRASKCEEVASSPWSGYRSQFRGQVTPNRRWTADGEEHGPVELHGGPFKSRWIRVRHGATVEQVRIAVDEAAIGATTSLYVGIPDDYVHSGSLVAMLRESGFRFHHFHDGSIKDFSNAPRGELIYYRWDGATVDLVPTYCTASEGVGVLVLSPDQASVLLVWEYGHWKVITGSVDAYHGMTDTVRKEVREEVGLELEESIRLVGGWQEAKARDKSVNSVFLNFTAVAKSCDFQVDNIEIQSARWFPVSALPTLEEERRAPKIKGKPHTMEVDLGVPGKNCLSRTVAHFLDVHRQGRGLHVSSRELDRMRDLFF